LNINILSVVHLPGNGQKVLDNDKSGCLAGWANTKAVKETFLFYLSDWLSVANFSLAYLVVHIFRAIP
jgi:hypothetical protein